MRTTSVFTILLALAVASPVSGEPKLRAKKAGPVKAIPVPVLDDRDYEALRGELLERTPVHTPEWTNRTPAESGTPILDPAAGTIRFGDGTHGRRPPSGNDNVRGRYRHGEGETKPSGPVPPVPGLGKKLDAKARGEISPRFKLQKANDE